MKKMICFSVIIPIYNAEATLKRCIDSVLKQTYPNIEIVIVDDGSTDGSGALCDAYLTYDGISVVHKVNEGVCIARNFGIQKASGDYILFLDSDDYLDENVCEILSKAVITGNYPDCIDFGIKYINTSGESLAADNKLEKNTLLNKDYLDKYILPPLLCIKDDPDHFILEYACNKAFKLEIIKKNNILFDTSRKVWEDKPFLLDYFRFCNSYYSVDNCYYNYVYTAGSLSQKYDVGFFDIILSNYCLLKKWYGNQFDFDTSYVNGYWCRSIEKMILRSFEEQENRELIEKSIFSVLQNEIVKEWYKNRLPENKEEEKANKLMELNDIQAVIAFYKTWSVKEQKMKKRDHSLLQRGKKRIKSLLHS